MHRGVPALLALAAASTACGGRRMIEDDRRERATLVTIEPRVHVAGDLLRGTGAVLSTVFGSSVDDPGMELSNVGGRVTLGVDAVDLVAGAAMQTIGDDEVREYELGLRVRDTSNPGRMPYLEASFRHGQGYESPSGDVDYDGLRIGAGVLSRLHRHWYLDVGLGWEWTFDRLELDAGESREHVSDFLLAIGLAYVL